MMGRLIRFGMMARRYFRRAALAGLAVALAIALLGAESGEQATPTKIGEVTQAAEVTEAPAVETEAATKTVTAAPATETQAVTQPAAKAATAAPATPTQVATQPATKAVTAAPTETAAPSAPESYSVGDVIDISDFVMVVLGWDILPANEFAEPDEGNQFVAVDLLLVNQTDSPVSVSTLLQMFLKDATSQKYNVDLFAQMAAEGGSLDGELAAGERLRGKVGFQVPENATGLEFEFDPNLLGSGKVFVRLGGSPISIEPPSKLAGEVAQETFKPGDIVDIGDFVLIVNSAEFSEGSDFAEPAEGKKFIVVDLTLENKLAESAMVSSVLQMSLKDVTGQKYSVNIMASIAGGGSTPDGELAPGEKLRAQVGFEVPSDSEGLVFVFDPNIIGTGRAFVALD